MKKIYIFSLYISKISLEPRGNDCIKNSDCELSNTFISKCCAKWTDTNLVDKYSCQSFNLPISEKLIDSTSLRDTGEPPS